MIGKTLLHYEVTARIGAGGMGEVYRATDTRLGRAVAIKVLPAEVAGDVGRLSRFRREARALAALHHPNVASLFGLEEADGQPFLVMELVEGEDLRKRLRREPMTAPEVRAVARQLALGLQEAHARGIVHRDLKPANVTLDPRGVVKILDFGLARLWRPDGEGRDEELSEVLTRSGATATGVVVGTAAYMSPEQARGEGVDKRSDIWSFGVVLFEMLCGRRPFHGNTSAETLAAVLKEEPVWEDLPADCPPALQRLVRRCLSKDPLERLQDIGDARWELEEPDGSNALLGAERAAGPAPGSSPILMVIGVLLGLGLGFAVARTTADLPGAATTPPLRLTARVAPEVDVSNGCFSISPDGRRTVITPPAGHGSMWLAPLDGNPARRLPGGAGGQCASFSPEGDRLVYLQRTADGWDLRRASLLTGVAVTLTSVPPSGGLLPLPHWGDDGWVVFGVGRRAYRVRESGGEAQLVFQLESGGLLSTEPLPGGRQMLAGIFGDGDARVALVDLETGAEVRTVLEGTTHAVVHGDEWIVFARDGTLYAQGFDPGRGALEGPPRRLSEVDVFTYLPDASLGLFDLSENGVLVFLHDADLRELAWFDRGGRPLGSLGEPGRYHDVALSPDDRSAVVSTLAPAGSDLWAFDTVRGVATRETSDAAIESTPIWSHDGRDIYFRRNPGVSTEGGWYLWAKRVGTSTSTALLEGVAETYAHCVSPDGRELVYAASDGEGGTTVSALRLQGGGQPRLVMRADHGIEGLAASPDERWLAYASNETGAWEVYVRPWGGDGRRLPVSAEGGRLPLWRGDGRELYYLTTEGEMMAVAFGADGPGEVRRLFLAGVPAAFSVPCAVSSDGQRFLCIKPLARVFQVMLNWPSLLE